MKKFVFRENNVSKSINKWNFLCYVIKIYRIYGISLHLNYFKNQKVTLNLTSLFRSVVEISNSKVADEWFDNNAFDIPDLHEKELEFEVKIT